MVRPARPGDLPTALRLATAMHAEAPAYRDRPFDAAKVEIFLRLLCAGEAKDMVLFVVERAGEVVGGIIGCAIAEWFNHERIAIEIALFVDPRHRRGFAALSLLRAFVEWGRLRGAVQVRAGAGTGVSHAGTVRLYRHVGFREMGPVLRLQLD